MKSGIPVAMALQDAALSVTLYLIAGFLPLFMAAPQSSLIFPSWWEIFKLLARRGTATVKRSVKLSIVSARQITAIRERRRGRRAVGGVDACVPHCMGELSGCRGQYRDQLLPDLAEPLPLSRGPGTQFVSPPKNKKLNKKYTHKTPVSRWLHFHKFAIHLCVDPSDRSAKAALR